MEVVLEHAESREAPNGSSNDGKDDRLSVYGIGLKRAIFKIGNTVENDIRSSEQWIFHETKR